VLWSLAYLVVRRLLELMMLCCRSPRSKELEILVLRHELSILRRHPQRPVGATNSAAYRFRAICRKIEYAPSTGQAAPSRGGQAPVDGRRT
jgi:uncharacterized alpha-E superfamily protein